MRAPVYYSEGKILGARACQCELKRSPPLMESSPICLELFFSALFDCCLMASVHCVFCAIFVINHFNEPICCLGDTFIGGERQPVNYFKQTKEFALVSAPKAKRCMLYFACDFM